jgi:hypothetical protein
MPDMRINSHYDADRGAASTNRSKFAQRPVVSTIVHATDGVRSQPRFAERELRRQPANSFAQSDN